MAETHRNPYPGLRPFRPQEEHLFFGREAQVDRMVERLARRRFIAVVGTSGSGKSSLVNCGLRPALHRGYMAEAGASWRVASFRPGSDPLAALAEALAAPKVLYDAPLEGSMSTQALVRATLSLGSLGLVTAVEQADLPEGTQLLVVVDQFEEVFRSSVLPEAAEMVQLLLQAVAQCEVPIHVVLTMRSDFLGDCAQFPGLPEAINESQYLVPRMSRDEIRAAITRPALVRGERLHPLLVTRLLNDVGDNPDQLSILQHALNRTWVEWEHSGGAAGDLLLEHYERTGGMGVALDRHAEKAFGELQDDRSKELCEKVFRALTDSATDGRGVRRMMRLSRLQAICGAGEDELARVLEVFRRPSRSFLMPPEPEVLTDDSDIDISHESLMRVWRRLAQWADAERRSGEQLHELARKAGVEHASLWTGPELDLAVEWRDREKPNAAWAELHGGRFEEAMRFLQRSCEAVAKQRLDEEVDRRWRGGWNLAPVAVAGALFVALQIWLVGNQSVCGVVLRAFSGSAYSGSEGACHMVQTLGNLPGDGGGLSGGLLPALGVLLPLISHLIAVGPAAALYVFIAPWSRKVFDRRMRLHLQQGGTRKTVDRGQVLPLARFVRRAGAQVVDWLLTIVMIPITLFLFFLAAGFLGVRLTDGVDLLVAIGLLVGVVSGYHVLFWSSRWRATPGMRLFRLQLVDVEGRKVSKSRATARFFARWVSYASFLIGFAMQPFNARRQTLHDRIAGTLVLHVPKVKSPA